MPSPAESRAVLQLVTGAAVTAATQILSRLSGLGEVQRADLLDAIPGIIGYYADGSSALAADFYDQEREAAAAAGRFVAEPVVLDRAEKIRRAIAWSTEPVIAGTGDVVVVEARLAEVVQLETARPYRDTIVTNRRRDPQGEGWRRVASGGCSFCRMLADRGAVYKAETARFASHPHCHCTAQPVFKGQPGDEADVMQYMASKRRRTAADRERVRAYLAANYPD